ncbi:MAG: Ig-like domain-containing protein, partial [Crocinitomicaceae bacterium]
MKYFRLISKSLSSMTSGMLFALVLFTNADAIGQCGFQSTCSNTNYLNFGIGSNTDASTIEFDNFISGYHQTLVRTSEGVYKTWGQSMGNNGTTDLLSPTIINSTNYPALTGVVLKAGIGSTSATSAEGVLLSTTGLFAWGKRGVTIPTNLTTSTTFQKLTVNGKTDGLPAGVNPLDVKMMFTTFHTVALLTCSGDVWVLTQQGENTGTGLTGALSAAAQVIWYRVTESTAGNPVLSNVIQLRGTANALIALKSDGTLWTWGTETFLGNASVQTSRNRATLMTLPSANPIKMIGATRQKGTSGSSYYVLNANGNLYALGENSNKQLGDWTTTDRTTWVQPKYTSAAGPVMSNIRWISPQEHDENYGNINIINSDSTNYNWGVANGDMLGRGAATDFDPGIPNGITTADKILAVETGGHTSMLSKKCEDFFGYVGHRTNGSMGDGTTTANTESVYTFLTAVVYICGATSASVDVTGTPSLGANGLYCNGTSTDLLPTPAGGTLSILSGPGTLSGTVLTFTGTGNTTVTVQYETTVNGCSTIVKQATVDLLTEDCVVLPIAINDSTTTNSNTNALFNVVANDSDADGTIDVASVDLDTLTAGQQTTYTTSEGNWSVDALGNVTFSPVLNFSGTATTHYTVNDNDGNTSNIALLVVGVNGVNTPPSQGNESMGSVIEDASSASTSPNLVANNIDPDGTATTVSAI